MNGPKRFLCFEVNEQQYAIPLLVAKEVIAVPQITPVPGSDSANLGIINLRGQIISLYDLRLKLGLKRNIHEKTIAIILDSENASAGVVVDSVDSVLTLEDDQISPPTKIDSSNMGRNIKGVCKHDSKLILVIDIGGVFNLTIRSNQLSHGMSNVA